MYCAGQLEQSLGPLQVEQRFKEESELHDRHDLVSESKK